MTEPLTLDQKTIDLIFDKMNENEMAIRYLAQKMGISQHSDYTVFRDALKWHDANKREEERVRQDQRAIEQLR